MVLAVEKNNWSYPRLYCFFTLPAVYTGTLPHLCNIITVDPFLWDTSIQGTPPFRGHKICPQKNVHIIFHYLLPQGRETLFVGPESQV